MKLLTVAVNRLDTWFRPGLLCIGDAAHAMSPVGGVGINLAIQDAVATANILVPRLRQGAATLDDLRAVQRRREWPTRMTQRVQVAIQNRVISNVLRSTGSRSRLGRCGCSGAIPCCGACPRASSAWASGPSTSGTDRACHCEERSDAAIPIMLRFDRDCFVAALLTRNPGRLWRYFHRHGRDNARP